MARSSGSGLIVVFNRVWADMQDPSRRKILFEELKAVSRITLWPVFVSMLVLFVAFRVYEGLVPHSAAQLHQKALMSYQNESMKRRKKFCRARSLLLRAIRKEPQFFEAYTASAALDIYHSPRDTTNALLIIKGCEDNCSLSEDRVASLSILRQDVSTIQSGQHRMVHDDLRRDQYLSRWSGSRYNVKTTGQLFSIGRRFIQGRKEKKN